MAQQKISYSVYCIVVDTDNRVLMVRDISRERKLTLPGGCMEQGELVTATANREFKEETGYDLEVGKLVGIFSHRKQIGIVCVFTAIIIDGQILQSTKETSWCGFVDIKNHDPNDIYPAQLGILKQFFSTDQSRWPIYNHMIPPLPKEKFIT